MGWIKRKDKDYPIPEYFNKNNKSRRYNILVLDALYNLYSNIKAKVLDLGKYFNKDYRAVREYSKISQRGWSKDKYLQHMSNVNPTIAANLKKLEEIRNPPKEPSND